MKDKYKSIIDKPYEKSTKRPHMSIHDRAAQFSSFAALTGHKEAVKETARFTENRITLDEEQIRKINDGLRLLDISLTKNNEYKMRIVYFVPDIYKSGGEYIEIKGIAKKIDKYKRLIIMEDGTGIPIDDIMDIDVEL